MSVGCQLWPWWACPIVMVPALQLETPHLNSILDACCHLVRGLASQPPTLVSGGVATTKLLNLNLNWLAAQGDHIIGPSSGLWSLHDITPQSSITWSASHLRLSLNLRIRSTPYQHLLSAIITLLLLLVLYSTMSLRINPLGQFNLTRCTLIRSTS